MKTYYFSQKSASIYSLIGLLTILMSSCGSYQNTSYHDTDGVYNDSERRTDNTTANNNQNTNEYKEYFGSLQDDPEIFTDPNDYQSPSYAERPNDSTYVAETGYSGWEAILTM